MKGKYITLQIRLACIKKLNGNQDLYQEVDKTIREHKRIMRQFRRPDPHVRINRQVPV